MCGTRLEFKLADEWLITRCWAFKHQAKGAAGDGWNGPLLPWRLWIYTVDVCHPNILRWATHCSRERQVGLGRNRTKERLSTDNVAIPIAGRPRVAVAQFLTGRRLRKLQVVFLLNGLTFDTTWVAGGRGGWRTRSERERDGGGSLSSAESVTILGYSERPLDLSQSGGRISNAGHSVSQC